MNPTQIQTTLAPILAAAAGFLAGKGFFGLDSLGWMNILGGLTAAAATVWGAIAARKNAMVTTVAQMPEVKSITLDKNAADTTPTKVAELNRNTPDNVKVA